ncbi:MAG: hypothetical protein LRY51_18125 [Geovibrio sp.]|nr:hypothetical protein [Geovibrio sp.]
MYLRIEGAFNGAMDKGYEIETEVTGSSPAKFRIPLKTGRGENGGGIKWGINRIAEIALPHRNMPDNTGRLYIIFRLLKDGEAVERAPQYNMVEVDLSDNFGDDWIV